MRKKLTQLEELELVDLYKSGKTTRELCIHFGYNSDNRHSILNRLHKYNIPIRPDNYTHSTKYEIDNTYFEKIDNQNKAYFLGLLYADGCNYTKKSEVKLSLVESDKDILLDFSKELKTNKPLRYTKLDHKSSNFNNHYIVCIENKKISKDLVDLGCVNKKSLVLKFPTLEQVPENLIPHFIRGYFDGDGCITYSYNKIYKKRSPVISFVSTKEFLDTLQIIFNKELGFSFTKFQKRRKNIINNYSIMYGGKKQMLKFYNWLYNDSNYFLKRKFKKFTELLNE